MIVEHDEVGKDLPSSTLMTNASRKGEKCHLLDVWYIEISHKVEARSEIAESGDNGSQVWEGVIVEVVCRHLLIVKVFPPKVEFQPLEHGQILHSRAKERASKRHSHSLCHRAR